MRATFRRRLLPLALALSMLLTACGGNSKTAAATMHLKRSEGTVSVADNQGKTVEPRENLGLYSGYGVDTQTESYAWIDLDEVKLTKMDQDSQIAITKEGKKLEIEVKSGSLFFNVTQPLAEDETLDIRTSSMLVGIRGTCGWVEVPDGEHMSLYLLEGTVECTAGASTATVNAGEMAAMTAQGEIAVAEFTARDVPAFVLEEVTDDSNLAGAILDDSGIDVLNPPEPDPAADALQAYQAVLAQADTYFPNDVDYGTMEVSITYKYALVQMQAGSQVPALILEQETYGDFWGDLCTAIAFQYDPDSQTVIQADGIMEEGVASAGGYRGSLAAAGDGTGILETSWHSATGEGSTARATVDGSSLLKTTIWSGNIYDDSSIGVESVDINWHELSDLSGLNGWTPPEISQPAEPEPEPDNGPLPTDGDRIVFRGTLNTYTYNEVLALQGIADPNPGSDTGETYQLIVLDEPQEMELRSSDPTSIPRIREVSIIAVSGMEQYNGQHLTFSIDPDATHMPSDTSLPMGQPSTSDIRVLN